MEKRDMAKLIEVEDELHNMEMFHADNNEQWCQIKNTIDMSDYYILIVGCWGQKINLQIGFVNLHNYTIMQKAE